MRLDDRGRPCDLTQLGSARGAISLLLGHRICEIFLGVDLDGYDNLVEMDTLAQLRQRAVDVLIRRFDGLRSTWGQVSPPQ